MVVSVFKTNFKNQKPKIVTYRHNKRFDKDIFRENISCDAIENLVFHILDKMALIKQKYIRGNQSLFMNKDIHKAIITRMRLRNRFLKEATLITVYKKLN